MKQVVIIGAGYAGILVAKKLEKKIRRLDDVEILLIDRNPFHTMYTELHEVAAHRVDEDSIKISLQRVFAGRRVTVVMDTITGLDLEAREAVGEQKRYSYDYLVLATGSRPAFFGVPGAAEHCHTLWSYDDAVRLREHIPTMFRLATREPDPEKRRKLLTFYVVGAGFTGVEMAGELAEYVPSLCERYEIPREEVTLCEVDILPRAVPILPEKLSDKVERRLDKMGVELRLGTSVASVGEGCIELTRGGQTEWHPAATVIWTAGIEGSALAAGTPGFQTERRGRVVTDGHLRAAGQESVFVAGDNLMYTSPGEEQPVPQMVENCERSADVVAYNLACLLSGQGELETYHPTFHGVMVSVGGRYGVARVGAPTWQINLPSFFAMFVKHFINIMYFMQVLGWNKVMSYLRHEFFTIRHCRSFVGGHFSNRTPSFLLVPLRVWLGAAWVFEAVKKIVEGWLTTPMLTGFFGGANAFYNQILGAAGARNVLSGAVDAMTSATAEAGETAVTGVALFSYRILGLFDATLVSATELERATINDYAFWVHVPLLDWFINNWVLPFEGVQLGMQIFIVLAELALGLAIAAGLFTTPASVLSLVLQAMFVTTTGLYLGTFWMIFAAIAVLFGGGSVFGLDYYAMPWLKRRWKRVGWARKWYLYHD